MFTATVWGKLPSGNYQIFINNITAEKTESIWDSGLKKNDKIIDLESSKEFKFFNVGLCVNDLFVNNFRCCVLGDYFPNNDIELSKNTILKKYEKIRTELFEKNYDKMNDLFRFVNDYDIGDYTLKNYYNDTNNDDYYDEYLEHRRSLLYGVNKEERKLKILM